MGLFGTGNAGAALRLFLVPQLEKWQPPSALALFTPY